MATPTLFQPGRAPRAEGISATDVSEQIGTKLGNICATVIALEKTHPSEDTKRAVRTISECQASVFAALAKENNVRVEPADVEQQPDSPKKGGMFR